MKEYDNPLDNKGKDHNYIKKDKTNFLYWFKNKNNSCVFDCIITIFINSLKKYIEKSDLNKIIKDDELKCYSINI